jgi:N-acetylglucosaminyl-diphospho-decaprenol L-rhamnosyltransferase
MKLGLVVVNYHSSAFVERLMTAVSSSWCSRVVIVDNSEDETEASRLTSLELQVPTEIIIEPSNIGFGGAANDGINAAFSSNPTDPVWLLNPDTAFALDTPEALIRRLELDRDDIVSPAVVTGNGTALRIWFAGGSVDRRTGNVVHDDYLAPYSPDDLPTARPTTFMCGAAPVFTGFAWATLRGFRDDLFLYWEDAELSLRAQDAGLRMTVINQSAPVWHAVGGTAQGPGQSDAFYFYSARNRLMIMLERGQWASLLRPRALAQFGKFALRPLRRERDDKFHKFWKVLSGYGTGLTTICRREASSR